MMNTVNTEFSSVEVWFTDQVSKALEIEDWIDKEPLDRHYKIEIFNGTKIQKNIKRYGFLSFARKFGDKYGKKIKDTSTKTGIDAAKSASKRVVQKTAEATGDLIGNEIADKITSVGKSKEKVKAKKVEEIYILSNKRQQNVTSLDKNGILKNCKLAWCNF